MANNDADPREPLIDAMMELRASAPEQWARLCQEMAKDAARTNARMVTADLTMLQRAQGMAIQANDIAKTMHEAPLIAQKFYEARILKNAAAQRR